MSTVLLAPTREGYLSLEPEGRLGATEHDHLAEDLMPGLVSWKDARCGRTSSCSRWHTDLAQRTPHLLEPYDPNSAFTVVYIIIRHPWIDRWSTNGLGVSKLPHDPLWSIIHNNGPPTQETRIAWNHMEVPDRSVLPIWDPTDIQNPESV